MGLKPNERNLTITIYRDDFEGSATVGFYQIASLFREIAKAAPSTMIKLLDKYPLAEKLLDAIWNHMEGNEDGD